MPKSKSKKNTKTPQTKSKKIYRGKKKNLFSRLVSSVKRSRKHQLVVLFVVAFATFGVYQLFFAEAAYKPWNPASATGKATWYCPPGCPTYDGNGSKDKGYCAAWRWGSAYHGDPHTLEVTNTANGRKITCKVNDQGPLNEFENRIIDLRKGDFAYLAGSLSAGVINVHVKCISGRGCTTSNPQPSAPYISIDETDPGTPYSVKVAVDFKINGQRHYDQEVITDFKKTRNLIIDARGMTWENNAWRGNLLKTESTVGGHTVYIRRKDPRPITDLVVGIYFWIGDKQYHNTYRLPAGEWKSSHKLQLDTSRVTNGDYLRKK